MSEWDRRDKVSFANDGQALCGSVRAGNGKSDIRCLFANGKTIPLTFGPRAFRYFSTASNAPILLALEYNYSYNPFTEEEHSSPRRWLLWDMQKDQTIITLPARVRQGAPTWHSGRSFPGAVVPSGRFVAFAADHSILVYEISR